MTRSTCLKTCAVIPTYHISPFPIWWGSHEWLLSSNLVRKPVLLTISYLFLTRHLDITLPFWYMRDTLFATMMLNVDTGHNLWAASRILIPGNTPERDTCVSCDIPNTTPVCESWRCDSKTTGRSPWCWMISCGLRSALQFTPKALCGVEVRSLCTLDEFFYTNLKKNTNFHKSHFVHRVTVALDQSGGAADWHWPPRSPCKPYRTPDALVLITTWKVIDARCDYLLRPNCHCLHLTSTHSSNNSQHLRGNPCTFPEL